MLCALVLLTGRVAVAQTCSLSASGPVAWWPGEGSAADVTGLHDGTLVGGVTFVPGMVGSAFSLDGNSFVRVPDSPALNPTNAITVEAWINPTPGQSAWGPIIKKNGTNDSGYALEMAFDGTTCFYVSLRSAGWVGACATIMPGQWMHVAGVYDGQQVMLYVNGVLAASVSLAGTIAPPNGSLGIGTDTTLNRYYRGLIDEPAVFARALTSIEIHAIHAAGAAGKCAVFDPSAPPMLMLPDDMTVSGSPSGRLVFFNASAWDPVDGPIPAVCTPASGSQFPIGTTQVTCVTTNSRNLSSSGSFDVTVVQVTTNEVGLLGHWKFDELGGTSALDSSGNGRDGATTGATYTLTDGAGLPANVSALRFDGGDVVIVPYTPAFNFSFGTPATFSFWIRPAATFTDEFSCMVNKVWASRASSDYAVCNGRDGVLLGWWNGSWPENTSVRTRKLEPGRLAHVAVVYDGAGTAQFYSDGQLDAAGGDHARGAFQGAVSTTGSNVEIGDRFHGMLDDVRIYNRALSPVEVASLSSDRGLQVDEVVAPYAGTATLKAVFFVGNFLVPGKTVTFTLGGVAVGTAVTNGDGVATLEGVAVSSFDPGEHPTAIGATVAADAQIAADSSTAMLTIVPAEPDIIWALPALDVGATLDLALLNATTSVAGTFEYADSSLIGTSLSFGQQLCVTFTPTDMVRYTQVTTCVVLTALGAAPVATARIIGGSSVIQGVSGNSVNPAIDRIRDRIYLPSDHDGEVIVADGTGGTSRSISLSLDGLTGFAGAMALDETRNRLYVADALQPLVWLVDPDAAVPVGATISMPAVVQWIEFNSSTNLLYTIIVDHVGSAYVTVIDPANPFAQVSIPFGCRPDSMAINPVANLIYIAGCEAVYVIDGDPQRPATFNTVVRELPVPSGGFEHSVAISRRTNRVYVLAHRQRRNYVHVFDADPGSTTLDQELAMIQLPGFSTPEDDYTWPTGLAIDESRQLLYARTADWQSNYLGRSVLTTVDLQGGTAIGISLLPPADQNDGWGRVGVNPITGRIYVTSSRNVTTVLEGARETTLSTETSAVPVTVASGQVSLTFAAVSDPGETTVTQIDPATLNTMLPGGFTLEGGPAFEILTTATVTAPIQVCFDASWVTDEATFATLVVLHGEGGVLVDRTVSRDFATFTICASVTSLSPFVIARSLEPTYGVVLLYDSNRPIRAGSTVPVRLQIADSNGVNLSSASLAVHAIELRQTSTSASSAVVNSGQANADMDFRFDPDLGGSGGYVFNLKTTGLSTGSHELRFTVGGGRRKYTVPVQIR